MSNHICLFYVNLVDHQTIAYIGASVDMVIDVNP